MATINSFTKLGFGVRLGLPSRVSLEIHDQNVVCGRRPSRSINSQKRHDRTNIGGAARP